MRAKIMGFVLSLLATQAVAERLSLGEISAYLNDLATAQGMFTQVNDDGSISTGQVYIRRPGRVRFEYAPPNKALVIAGGGQVAVFDPKSNVPPEQYPLKRTPLNLILARDIDLTRAKMVVAHREDGPSTVVTAQDPEHPEYGSIEMYFTGSPVELRKWVITDDSGSRTEVVLGALETGVRLRAGLFNIRQETSKRIKN
ncbi:MAG: outer membrane lipoprotein carrier protein LolA [Pseudomonadota bacterium]